MVVLLQNILGAGGAVTPHIQVSPFAHGAISARR